MPAHTTILDDKRPLRPALDRGMDRRSAGSRGHSSPKAGGALLAGLSSALFACLDTVPPPQPTPQAQVRFPERLYLADPSASFCRGLYTLTPTTAIGPGFPGAVPEPEPHNCYVPVATGAPALPVDQHEVTNEQFQLCVDSGACRSPDPSEVEPDDVCVSEDEFDKCPVVGVSYQEAKDYCEWTGRRLPSGLEMVLIRQAGVPNITDTSTPPSEDVDGLPSRDPLLPIGDTIPTSCEGSVLGNSDCRLPRPVDRNGALGAAAGDALGIIPEKGQGTIYDLVGNVAELIADLAPERGNRPPRMTQPPQQVSLPWFCVADLPEWRNPEVAPAEPTFPFGPDGPQCPTNTACVMGRYAPPGLAVGLYPVCIAARRGVTSGVWPIVVGGSYNVRLLTDAEGLGNGTDTFPARSLAGIYGRRVFTGTEPDQIGATVEGTRIGFRCVGQRDSAPPNGPLLDFQDTLGVVVEP